MTSTSASLPADQRSPAQARRHLRAALAPAGLEHVLDDALVLVTELVTNAVVHAGTAVELHLDTTAPGLRVEVVDHGPGSSLTLRAPAPESSESGRGLHILDALASRWGTTHGPGSKSVWFELDRPVPSPAASPARPAAARPVPPGWAPAGAAGELPWSLLLPDDLVGRLDTAQVLLELVHRLGDALDLDDVHLLAADGDAGEWSAVAVRGAAPRASAVVDAAHRAGSASGPVLRSGGDLVLPLAGRDAVLGALVLGGAGGVDATGTALARLVAERIAVLVRDARTDEAVSRERGSLALLAEASEMFAGTLDVQLAVTLAAQLVVPRFARWAAVHTSFDREPSLDAVAHADEEEAVALRAALADARGRALAAEVGAGLGAGPASQRPVLLAPAALPEAVRALAPGDVLALPLVARHRLIGSLLVAHAPGVPFTASDVEVLLDLARRAALAVDNARLYEERTGIAQALQASLLPPELPRAPHVDFGARYVAAGEGNEVGGDFYDVFALPDGGWAVAIGDVCGKGAEAAAITGLARNVLRLLLRQGCAPSECLRELNAAILDLDERGRFVTGAVATLRVEGDGLVVRMCVAGHPSPVHLRAGVPPVLVGRNGTVLGVTSDVDLEDERVRLATGEAVVFYTDGVTERRRGLTMFGEETLLAVLAAAGQLSADAVAGCVEQAVRSFGPEASRDDLAVLVVRATGLPPGRPGVGRAAGRRPGRRPVSAPAAR
jgi:serine phosphatase RsbU (regulator of sigma subunit)/anti-sigma regulatory factor (Ser/Thr protein kinase)